MRYLAQAVPPADPLNETLTVPGNFQPVAGKGAVVGGQPLTLAMTVGLGLFTVVGGMLFLLYFILGALSWITSGGDKGKVEKARSQLTNAALGLIIVIVSQAIAGIVGGVLGLDILRPVNMLESLFN